MKKNVINEEILSHEYLLEILEYFPDTGIFIWKVNFKKRKCLGREAGCKDKSTGRHRITINQILYLRARLAWFYVHGGWPKDQIDHKNRIKDDDRIENLRKATQEQNNWNTFPIRKYDLPKGIYHNRNKFIVVVQYEKRRKYLGNFSNLEDAIAIRNNFDETHRKFLFEY